MVGEIGSTTKASSSADGKSVASVGAKGLDTRTFAVEVANEIGVDMESPGVHGLTPGQIRQHEAEMHGARARNTR